MDKEFHELAEWIEEELSTKGYLRDEDGLPLYQDVIGTIEKAINDWYAEFLKGSI